MNNNNSEETSNFNKIFKNKILKSLDEIKTFSKENLNILHSQKEKLNDCDTKLDNMDDDINVSRTLINSMSGGVSNISLNTIEPLSDNFKKLNKNNNKINIKNKLNLIGKNIHKIKDLFESSKLKSNNNNKIRNEDKDNKDNKEEEDEDFDLILKSIKEIKDYNKAINFEIGCQEQLIDNNIGKTENNSDRLKSNIKKINKIIDS